MLGRSADDSVVAASAAKASPLSSNVEVAKQTVTRKSRFLQPILGMSWFLNLSFWQVSQRHKKMIGLAHRRFIVFQAFPLGLKVRVIEKTVLLTLVEEELAAAPDIPHFTLEPFRNCIG